MKNNHKRMQMSVCCHAAHVAALKVPCISLQRTPIIGAQRLARWVHSAQAHRFANRKQQIAIIKRAASHRNSARLAASSHPCPLSFMYEVLLNLSRRSMVGSCPLRQRKMTYILAFCTKRPMNATESSTTIIAGQSHPTPGATFPQLH